MTTHASGEPCRLLGWDSDFFGFPIAAVARERVEERDLPSIEAWCEAHQVRCLYYECPAAEQASIRAAERGGFELVDVRLLFVGRARGGSGVSEAAPVAVAQGGVAIRPAVAGDLGALKAIAAESHRDSRFFADERFASNRAARLFSTWIENAVGGNADVVLVAEAAEGDVAGYAALRVIAPVDRQRTAGRPRAAAARGRLDLFAVAPAHRRRGIGRRLIEASRAWLAEKEVTTILAATQARNAAAQHLYQRCGFVLSGVWLYYHRWFDRRGASAAAGAGAGGGGGDRG